MSTANPDTWNSPDSVKTSLTSNLEYDNTQLNILKPSEKVWRFYVDILLTLALAICSFLANIGLLCLARLTRPVSQANNSSFSANFTTTNNINSTSSSTNLANNIFAFDPLYTPRRSVPTKRSKCLDYSQGNSELERLGPNPTLHLKKCASSVSLLRFSQSVNGTTIYSSTGPCCTRRSRRQRRYLRGLFGLSISNLTLSISLVAYSICKVLLHHNLHNHHQWIHWLQFASVWLADMAQSLELGAVLWIALERTLGIHWPTEKRAVSLRTERPRLLSSSSKWRLCRRLQCCDRTLEATSPTLHEMTRKMPAKCPANEHIKLFNVFKKWPKHFTCFEDVSCFCKQDHHPSYRSLSKSNRKNLSHFIRLSLCILPSLLFLTALVYKITSLWADFDTSTNQTNTFSLTNICLSDTIFLEDEQLFSVQYAWFPIYLSTNETSTPVYYYTDPIVSALIIGQFLAPLAILVTTNLLIYRKVAARDKRFFSRQSSNTSKSSFISTGSSITTTTTISASRKTTNATISFPIPLLRVLESSNQDVRVEETEVPFAQASDMMLEPLQSDLQPKSIHSLLVPPSGTGNQTYCEPFIRRHSPERRNSTSAIGSTNFSLSCILDYRQSGSVCPDTLTSQPNLLISPQQRRKSTNDIFSSLFQSKTQDTTISLQKSNEEPLLLQVLRRQHRRTLRILIILLLVFVMCRAPRSIVLLIQWLITNSCTQGFSTYLNNWLQYTSLWAYTSAILDTIVYGFWGNRTYRVHLRHWYARCSLCTICK